MGAHQNHLPEKSEREMTEGGGKKTGDRAVREGESRGGGLPPPVQTVVALICSISTITSSASSLIVISVIFTHTQKPALSCK